MWSKLKYYLLGLLILVLVGLSFIPRPVEIEAAEVTRSSLQIAITEDGKTRVKERFQIIAPITGQLSRIALRPGDPVEAGVTRLAEIEPLSSGLLDARTRAEAEARLRAAEAAQRKTEDDLRRVGQAEELARINLERFNNLATHRIIAEEILTQAAYEFSMKEAENKAAQQAVAVARFNLEGARAALIEGGEGDVRSEKMNLRAPIDGHVFRVFEESGGFVQAGAPLLELADTGQLEVVVDLLSKDAVKVKPGAEVRLEHWGGSQPLRGRVRLVEPSGFTKVSVLGVEEQRVDTIIDFLEWPEDTQLGDGFRVEARIIVWEGKDLLTIPVSALFRGGESWAVFRIEGNRARKTPVEVGKRNDLLAEVTSGLDAGDRVVLYPGDQLADGMRVSAR